MHTIALPINRLEESSRQTILRGGVLHIDTDHAQDTALLICEALDALPLEVLRLAVGGCLNLQRGAVRATLDRLGSADGRKDLDEARALLECTQDVVDGFAGVFPNVTADERARIVAAVGDGKKGVSVQMIGNVPTVTITGHLDGPVTAEIPAQDCGEALVGVECWLYDGVPIPVQMCRGVVEFYAEAWGYCVHRDHWEHARPVALGLPQ